MTFKIKKDADAFAGKDFIVKDNIEEFNEGYFVPEQGTKLTTLINVDNITKENIFRLNKNDEERNQWLDETITYSFS